MRRPTSRPTRPAAATAALTSACAAFGCGGAPLPSAPEPATSPPLRERPAGRVVAVGDRPEGVVVDPATGLAAVGVSSPAGVALVDVARGRLVRRVRLAGSPRHLQLERAGGPVLVPAERANLLLRVALPTGKVVGRTRVGENPHDATFAGGRVFVSDELAGAVSVLGAGRTRVVSGFVQPAGVTPTARAVAVVDVRANTATLLDRRTLRRLGALHVGSGLTHVVPAGRDRVAVVDTRGGGVFIVRTAPALRVVRRIPLAGAPYGIAADVRHGLLWVTLTARNRVVALPLGATSQPMAALPTVRQPNSVAVDPDTGAVVVAGRRAGVLEVIAPGRRR